MTANKFMPTAGACNLAVGAVRVRRQVTALSLAPVHADL